MMNVFISWSGDRSRRLAKALSPLLSGAIPDLRVWMSDALEPGTAWLQELNEKLEESDVGVLCLTPENMDAAWLLFEAGALAKKFSKSRVVPYNLGVPDD